MKTIRMVTYVVFGIWISGALIMMSFYEIERKYECIDQEGLLKGLFWCKTDLMSNSAITTHLIVSFIKGLEWPNQLFADDTEKRNDVAVTAEWSKMGEIDDGIFYIDHATIHKAGHFVKARLLINLNKAMHGISSIEYLNEYDCKEKRNRALSSYAFSGQMRTGKNVAKQLKPEQWATPSESNPILPLLCHEWSIIHEDETIKYYLDQAFQRNEQLVKTWILMDLKDSRFAYEKGFFSFRVQIEYDCKGSKKKLLDTAIHSGSMAFGDLIGGFSGGELIEENNRIDPLDKIIFPIVCN